MTAAKKSKLENTVPGKQSGSRAGRGLLLHFRPRTVPERTLRFTLTWGLGGSAAVLVMLLIGTGLLLKFVYQPFPDLAYSSILSLQREIGFGRFIRSIHHWSANILVIVVFLHMLRVFFTGAFQPPRQGTWLIGLGLIFLTLGANFTGYLLPYDQLAYWAVTVSTGMLDYIPVLGAYLQKSIRGGTDIGPATLSIFYALHTAVIPVCLFVLMAFHFWRIRKAGGLVIPRPPESDMVRNPVRVPVMPNLLLRELVMALVVIAAVMVLSVFLDAPLEDPANPGLSPNPTKAPWYFAGIQELLLHFHPLFAVLVIPSIVLAALASLPYLKYDAGTAGIWFCSDRGRRMSMVAALVAVGITPLGIIADEYFINFEVWFSAIPTVISSGLLPASLVLVCIITFYWLMKKKFTATNNEAIQSVFILLLVAFIILTVTCIWFRGSGMTLVWPF